MEEKNIAQSPKTKMTGIVLKDDPGSGVVCVSSIAVAGIIKKYLLEIDGVARLAPKSLIEGIAGLLSRRSYDSNILMELDENGKLQISISVVLRFGEIIPEVAKNIQDVIFTKITELTGYPVGKVNVDVVDLDIPQPEENLNETAAIPGPMEQ